MKQFNIICKFSDFVQEITGLNDSEECMAFIEKQDLMAFVDSQNNAEFLTETDMIAIWDSWVEIRIKGKTKHGIYILNLTVFTPDVNNPYNSLIIECGCIELESLLRDIIKRNI